MEFTKYRAKQVLGFTGRLWLGIAFIGQWLFGFYILLFYGPPLFQDQLEKWNSSMPDGYLPDDVAGNIIMGLHLLPAGILLLGGPLQIIPQIRSFAPTFHRWNGRIYLITAFLVSLSGFYLTWNRSTVGDNMSHLAISINSVLIILCGTFAWRTALALDFKRHAEWVLRLFLVVGGVWFFRLGMMLWLFIFREPIGFNPQTVTGPFITTLTFIQYLIPLGILELYFFIKRSNNHRGQWLMAFFMCILSLGTGLGIFLTSVGMWLPRL